MSPEPNESMLEAPAPAAPPPGPPAADAPAADATQASPAEAPGADASGASPPGDTPEGEVPLPPKIRKIPFPHNAEAEKIAALMGEYEHKPRLQVRRMARMIGVERLRELFVRTLEAEEKGGLLRLDGTRRTIGGVFFYLAKEFLSEEEHIFTFGYKKDQRGLHRQRLPRAPRQPTPPRKSIEELTPQERAEMTIPGKLELTLKIDKLPAKVHTDQNGWKVFWIACGDREVEVKLRPKHFTKLTDAAAQWPLWVATIGGVMGPLKPKGFELLEPNVMVFERKAKPPKDAAAAEGAPADAPKPADAPAPKPAPAAAKPAPAPAKPAPAPAKPAPKFITPVSPKRPLR